MKSILAAITLFFGIVFILPHNKSDNFIRHQVFKIVSATGQCTGEQVNFKGKQYIITAGHCGELKDAEGRFKVIDEEGQEFSVKFVAEDPVGDIIAMEGIEGYPGLNIGEKNFRFQHIRSFTHGEGYATYKTEGEIVGGHKVEAPLYPVLTAQAFQACVALPKYHVGAIMGLPACILSVDTLATTMMIAHGSSGGAVVDDRGDLVGIATATNEKFGFITGVEAIRKFLGDLK